MAVTLLMVRVDGADLTGSFLNSRKYVQSSQREAGPFGL